jgi:transglutaminase-like putative cysteine protease
MRRRAFLQAGGAALLAGSARRAAAHEGWHAYEVTTRLAISGATGVTRAWIPLPLPERTAYQRTAGDTWTGNAAAVTEWTDEVYGARLLHAEWPASEKTPRLEVVSRVATRDHAGDPDGPPLTARLAPGGPWLQPSRLMPLDGIVRTRALEITAGRTSDVAKARAIYDWVVENTFRDPAVRGCGRGDIATLLQTGALGGKCADLNALFVGLARAAGVPAREVFGLRVAPSATFASLGQAGDVTRSQHCRAEFYAAGQGWIPVDPADVRKVILEEPPRGRTLADPLVVKARRDFFGFWEMNWIAYNRAHDIALPGAAGDVVPFLMYPQCETGGTRKDSLAPETFSYEITSRETAV